LTFILPCKIEIASKKYSLNLNWYRNAHFQTLAKVKRAFAPIGLPAKINRFESCTIVYTLNIPDKRRTDAMNWISVIDKFFLDWMVSVAILPDDNASVYTAGAWCVTHDKNQPLQVVAEITGNAPEPRGISRT
jgi:hypothetical protein